MVGKSELDIAYVVFIILVLILLGAGIVVVMRTLTRGVDYEQEYGDLG